MNFKFLLFTISLIVSCGRNIDQCNSHSEQEIKAIERMMNLNFADNEGKWVQASAYERLIQYHAHEDWGQYEHIIRMYKVNHHDTIELMSKMKKGPDRKLHSIRRKIELEPEDAKSLWDKAEILYCKEVDLEPDFQVIDGEYFDLLISDGMYRQGFSWQTMKNDIRDGRIPPHKDAVTEIVGDLMRLCEFPNGEKFIDLDSNYTTDDSIAFEVFFAYAYNVHDYKVYFDDNLLLKDQDGLAKVKVSVADTMNLRQRIRIKASLLDKSEVEF